MNSSMSLKALIRNLSQKLNIPAQAVMQNYMFEKFLLRLEKSSYRNMFVLKGGFLISALVGISSRTTMDLDITIKGMPLRIESIESIMNEIVTTKVDDFIDFRFVSVDEIRETEDYPGLRVKLEAIYETIKVSMKLDLTTGDVLTPDSIEFSYPMFSENKSIHLFSYNLETILAEKLETILSRSVLNTRPRDFYDVFLLERMFKSHLNLELLHEALHQTALKRGTEKLIEDFRIIIETIRKDERMNLYWIRYQNQFDFAKDVSFEETIRTVWNLLEIMHSSDGKPSAVMSR